MKSSWRCDVRGIDLFYKFVPVICPCLQSIVRRLGLCAVLMGIIDRIQSDIQPLPSIPGKTPRNSSCPDDSQTNAHTDSLFSLLRINISVISDMAMISFWVSRYLFLPILLIWAANSPISYRSPSPWNLGSNISTLLGSS